MLLLFPGIDMLRVFTQRILKGKHPFNPDKNHIHHIITKSLSQTKAVIIIFFSYFLPILFFIITSKFIISLSILILIYVTIFLNFKKINGKI